MPDEKKAFMRTLCLVSATMASLCFVGVSVIISVYFNLPENVSVITKKAWLNVANMGVIAVALFATTSFGILFALFPLPREEERPASVIMRQIIKRKRLLRIAKIMQRIIAAISNWRNENAIGFLFTLFIASWFTFFIMIVFLFNAFHV